VVHASGQAQHGECAAQGLDATGDQSRGDGLNTITPQLLEKLQQSREIVVAEFREGKTEPSVDLQVNSPRAEPVPVPALSSHGSHRWHGTDFRDHTFIAQGQPVQALVRGCSRALGQSHVGDPVHASGLVRDDGSLALSARFACCRDASQSSSDVDHTAGGRDHGK